MFGTWVLVATADSAPDSTWVALKPLPGQGRTAVFAVAVDPANDRDVLAGNSEGAIFRSTDGGGGWTTVHEGTQPVTTIAFSPFQSELVLAGTRGGGALESSDGGASWKPVSGLSGRAVRVFAFALPIVVAGTDSGVYVSADGLQWTASGLAGTSIDAIAVEAIHPPVKLLAGGDSLSAGGALTLYQSNDAGSSWNAYARPLDGTIAVRMVAGPLPPTGNIRPLLVCTNTGLFASADNGTTFSPLSGGNLLPSTDYTQAAFVTDHANRYYVASDGGGSGAGGLWRTSDGGASFASLAPPQQSVTALAVSNDESPFLYVATFRPADHEPFLWIYHDTGGPPQQPPASPVASGARTGSSPAAPSRLQEILQSPQLPYVVLGAAALAVLIAAAAVHLRTRYR